MRKHYARQIIKPYSLFFTIALLVSTQSIFAQPDGEKLFKANCAACHKPDKDLVGPALQGVTERWAGNEEMLYLWIKNPQKALDTGDPQVKAIWDEWYPKAGPMTPQAVNDEEITAILEYVENYKPEEPAAAGEATITHVQHEDSGIWIIILSVLLLVAIVLLRNTIFILKNAVQVQKGEEELEQESVGDSINHWIGKNRTVTVFAVMFVGVMLIVSGWDSAFEIGVYTGYQPEQPIDYSHKVHAGDLEIECVYCHSGALKSRTAGIPSANVCMNCHKAVSTGKITGTQEIQKIYDAIGWDGSAYTGETEPIKWVKVHNLPDHVYFSHQQHYVVGDIDCTKCHGEMTEVGVARQNEPLTMGWCLDCHNTQQVDLTKNAYYEEVHQRLVDNGEEVLKKYLEDGKITVRELGGYECSKCHY
jgi:cytochrome c551/c552